MTNDLQQARIQAAARAYDPEAWSHHDRLREAGETGLAGMVAFSLLKARAALAAADAHLPSVEMIAEVIQRTRWRAVDSGTNPRIDYTDSMDIARAVRALLGEVAGDE